MKSIGLLLSLLTSLAAPTAWALPCSNNANPATYPLFCRGGNLAPELDTAISGGTNLPGGQENPGVPVTTITAVFVKGTKPAGAAGVNVPSGSCAWTDRAFAATEPNVFQTWAESDNGSTNVMQTLVNCMMNSNCIFETCAYNQNGVMRLEPFGIVLINAN